jgi:hypothetical protein
MQLQGGQPFDTGLAERIEALGGRADALWRRLVEIEDALAVREWWMLGRSFPEARLLAEISSLLAVARGEMENALSQGFGYASLRADSTDQYNAVGRDDTMRTGDPAWVAGCREQAVGLLRMIASGLPPMLQYAQMLRNYGEQLGIATPALDSFGIVTDRLNEINDALRQPPQ